LRYARKIEDYPPMIPSSELLLTFPGSGKNPPPLTISTCVTAMI